ncbi:MAG: NAD(P)H-binding protein [Phycisphaerales bacterium]
MTTPESSRNMSSFGTVVALTGATGFVGRNLALALLAAGYSVRALVRNREKARDVLPNDRRLSMVIGDAANLNDARELLRGANICINLVGIIREDRKTGQTFQRIHVDVTRVLVAACEELGVQRFLQMSAIGASDTGVCAYQTSKFDGENALRLSKLKWTIMRCSMIHGKDGEFIQQAQQWCKGEAAPWFFLPYFTGGKEDPRVPLGGTNPVAARIAPVAVEDVCAAFINAISKDATFGEIYNLSGPDAMTWPQMLTTIRDNTPGAHKFSPFGIPAELAALKAKAMQAIGLGSLLPFDEGMAKMGAQDSFADLTKARQDLNFAPRPFARSYAAYAHAGH